MMSVAFPATKYRKKKITWVRTHINKFPEVTDDVAKQYLKDKKIEALISLAIECTCKFIATIMSYRQ